MKLHAPTPIKKIFQLLSGHHKKKVGGLLFLILIGTLLEMLGFGLIIPLVGIMMSPDAYETSPIFKHIRNQWPDVTQEAIIFSILGLMAAIYMLKTMYLLLLAWIFAGFNLEVQTDISKRLLKSYLLRPWLDFQKGHTATYIQNTNNEVQILMQQGVGAIFEIAVNLALLIAASVLLLFVEPTVTLLISGLMGFTFWSMQKLSHFRVLHWGKIRKENEAVRLKYLQQALNSAKDIRLWNNHSFFIDKFHERSLKLIYSGRWQSTLRKFPRYFFELTAVVGLCIAILSMIRMGSSLQVIAPTIALFAAVFIKLMPSANSILTGLHSIRYIEPTIDTIYKELSDNYMELKNDHGGGIFENVKIKLNNLEFSYPGEHSAPLKDISLNIPFGTSVGFIGTSGAGKSTLISLILGLLTPDKGSITGNGYDIHNHLSEWQKEIGYVPQSIYLLDDTIKRNIAFGIEDSLINEKRIDSVLEQAQLKDFVDTLPYGADTKIGESGGFLSGGERQRVALARAIYRNPSVLVLDEATASLDSRTEDEVMRAVYCLKEKRTVINVSHNSSINKYCDVIVRIDQGKISEVDYRNNGSKNIR